MKDIKEMTYTECLDTLKKINDRMRELEASIVSGSDRCMYGNYPSRPYGNLKTK